MSACDTRSNAVFNEAGRPADAVSHYFEPVPETDKYQQLNPELRAADVMRPLIHLLIVPNRLEEDDSTL